MPEGAGSYHKGFMIVSATCIPLWVLSDGCELVSVCQHWQSVRPPEDRATLRERRHDSA
jgi:hypothetical protein